MALPTPDQWLCEHLRATFFGDFSAFALGNNGEGLWQKIVGHPPEQRSQKFPEILSGEDGPYEGQRLIVNVGPGRMDVILAPTAEAGWPSIGSLDSVHGKYLEVVGRVVSLIPPSERVAFGGAYMVRITNAEQGYDLLREIIPDFNFRPGVKDFQIQVNYPLVSERIGGDINRLWKIFAGQLNVVTATGAGASQVIVGHMVRVEVDINTDARISLRVKDPAEIATLMQECADHALVMIAEGVKP